MTDTKKQNRYFLILGFVFLLVTILFTILVKAVDVTNFVAENPITGNLIWDSRLQIGFSNLNKNLQSMIGFNNVAYKASEIIGYISFTPIIVFGLFGLIQLIKRKSLLKVDSHILVLGAFFIVTLIIYFVFLFVKVNYRPYALDDKLEGSYPSSHTILALCTMIPAIIETFILTKNKFIRILVSVICSFILLALISTRIISGVHWFSDIIAGILYGATLISFYLFFLKKFEKKVETK